MHNAQCTRAATREYALYATHSVMLAFQHVLSMRIINFLSRSTVTSVMKHAFIAVYIYDQL